MTVAFGSIGNFATGPTSLAVPYPASIAAGDLLVLCIASKAPADVPTVPSGWTLPPNCQASAGLGSPALNAGPALGTVLTKIADGTESGNLTLSIPNANASVARMMRFTKGAAAIFGLSAAFGTDVVAGTGWSATASTHPRVSEGDIVVAVCAINAQYASFTGEAITQAGVTYTSETERHDGGHTAGDNVRLVISTHVCSTGHSTGVPTFAMTGNTSASFGPTGVTIFLRIGERMTGGAIPISVTSSGALEGVGHLEGTVEVGVEVDGDITGHAPIDADPCTFGVDAEGELVGVGHLDGEAAVAVALSGTMAGVGELVGLVPMAVDLVGGITGVAPLDGVGPIPIALAPLGELGGVGRMDGTAPLAVAVAGELGGVGHLSGPAPIVVAASGILGAVGHLDGLLELGIDIDGLLNHFAPKAMAVRLFDVEPATQIVVSATPSIAIRIHPMEAVVLNVDDVAKVRADFKVDGELADPDNLKIEIRPPVGAAYELTYPAAITKLAVGRFQALIPLTEAGRWRYRWVATGDAQGAERGSFEVDV